MASWCWTRVLGGQASPQVESNRLSVDVRRLGAGGRRCPKPNSNSPDAKPPWTPGSDLSNYKAAGKLQGKAARITGGDSGIGWAVAVTYAMEGADVAIVYLNEH